MIPKDRYMKRIAKFQKVSFRRFQEDWEALLFAKIQADIRAIYQDIRLPQRATSGSAGYDFYAPVEIALQPGESIWIPTGVRVQMDEGWVLTDRKSVV